MDIPRVKYGLLLLLPILFQCTMLPQRYRSAEALIEASRSAPLNEYRILRAPTPPAPVKTIYPEWAPAAYLVLAMPYNDALTDSSICRMYMDVITGAIRYTDILVLVEEDKPAAMNRLLLNFADNGLSQYVNRDSSPCITVMPAPFNTKWIRDYGPVFGKGRRGKTCLIDAIYGDVRIDVTRNRDDEVPSYLAVLAPGQAGSSFQVVRPPFQLWGGDFQTDGLRNGFCSTETLIMNGAQLSNVAMLFRNYYGINRAVFFKPLPGQTIKHIDMFLKIVDGNTVLVGSMDRSLLPARNRYENYLITQAAQTLDRNAEDVARAFPGKKVIRMPMPFPEIDIKNESRLALFETMLIHAGRQADSVHAMPDSQIVSEAISHYRHFLVSDSSGASGKAAEQELLAKYADTLFKTDPGAYTLAYRTHLNSVFINGRGGKVLLVPSYSGCAEIEKTVLAIYRQVYPGADILMINCDAICRQYGALHCITSVIPDIVQQGLNHTKGGF